MREDFSAHLAIAIAKSGKSKGALAAHCGVALSTVSRWLNGSLPKVNKVEVIARFLGVDAKWLAGSESYSSSDSSDPIIEPALRSAFFELGGERRRRLELILLQSENAFDQRVKTCLESLNQAFDLIFKAEKNMQDRLSGDLIETLRKEISDLLADAVILRNFAETHDSTVDILRSVNRRDQELKPHGGGN